MPRAANPGAKRTTLSVKVDVDRAALVYRAADNAGLTVSAWLAQAVEGNLVALGLICPTRPQPPAKATARREVTPMFKQGWDQNPAKRVKR